MAISTSFIRRHGPARDTFAQRHAFDELDRDVVRRIDLPDLVHGHDVRVIERGSRARLELQTLQLRLVGNE